MGVQPFSFTTMSTVITFSTSFPSYHRRKNQPTYFVEKMLLSLGDQTISPDYLPKGHTIRAGNRWKVGDKFSPRIWSGRPYHTEQITFAPDVEVKKVWDFTLLGTRAFINGAPLSGISRDALEVIAANDGLSYEDFLDWFKFPSDFSGQIIAWDQKIEY